MSDGDKGGKNPSGSSKTKRHLTGVKSTKAATLAEPKKNNLYARAHEMLAASRERKRKQGA